mgnify:CR=1 FL=1
MKKLYLVILLSLMSYVSYAQSGISFECNNYEFTVYPDERPLEFSYKLGDSINYDYQGRVSSIGSISITYDIQGRVSNIGSIRVSYDFQGRVSSIGGMSLTYDFQGRLTGSYGSLTCNF